MRKLRVYNFEDCEMWIADGYEDLSNLFMALNADDSMYSPLMQSTGLLDSSTPKREIFEGDIVKVTDGDERTDFSDGGNGTICGLDDLYMWYIDGQVQNGLFDINQEHYIEVIGNIYQNPELLEGTQDDTKV